MIGTGASAKDAKFDIVIYGGTSAGVSAAVQAARMGKSVAIVAPETHLGGLSSGGLGWTDTGNKAVIGGIAREFYHRVWQHYQRDEAWKWQERSDYGNRGQGTAAIDGEQRTMWIFEPHVAEAVFEALIAEHQIPVFRDHWLDREDGVEVSEAQIQSITTLNGDRFVGRVFIDATYEGDLMAAAGVEYHVGREGQDRYGEQWAGVQTGVLHHRHHFGVLPPISPYAVPGDASSGVLPLISDTPPGEYGSADHRIQAYCFRLCLTNHPDNRVSFTKPPGYDPQRYELLSRIYSEGWRETFSKFDPIPNRKTDTNNHGPLSSDFIGANYDYPEASYAKRREIIEAHRNYQLGWLYFNANDPSVPEDIRKQMNSWGLAKDEFVDNDHWPHQIYVREARRMVGSFVMTEHELLGEKPTPHSVGMGSYTIDSHNVQRYITPDGHVQNEGDIGVKTNGPYQIAYDSLVPKREQCKNLLVPVCVSSSHVAFGSIRMEPVFMILGQSSATAAALAMDDNAAVQDVPYADLRKRLLEDGQVLEYEYSGDGMRLADLPGVVIDDASAIRKGSWEKSHSTKPYVKFGYSHDGDKRDGSASISFSTNFESSGQYELRVLYPPHENRCSRVPIDITINDQTVTRRIDQRSVDDGQLNLRVIGVFDLPENATATVVLSNENADGYVVADAIQWLQVENELVGVQSSNEAAQNEAAQNEADAGANTKTVVFNRDIRPLLSDRCFACHGPDEAKREADLRLDMFEDAVVDRGGYAAIVAGDVEASELIQRVLSEDDDLRMPPPDYGKELSEEDVALLKAWIEQGAEYQQHWAFTPVQRPDVPGDVGSKNGSQAIDAFINRRLQAEQLQPNPKADPRTLIRRLSFDLTGLPPEPEWVRQFVDDPSPETLQQLIDEMLASPHYGERMAMYWLDLVRYADTLGYHGDQDRSVWPYRDWVIRAFNNNMPFDQFTREQLAGDLLDQPTLEQRVASTYNRLNRASGEGGVQPKEYLAKYSADRVRTLGSVWLGTTLGCAECHDHKFDPYTAKDFYQVAAFFADIKEQGIVSGANHIAKLQVPSEEQKQRRQELANGLSEVSAKLEAEKSNTAEAFQSWLAELQLRSDLFRPIVPDSAVAESGADISIAEQGQLLVSGNSPAADNYVITFAPPTNRLGAIQLQLLPHDSFPQKGPGRAANGNLVITKVVLSQGERIAKWGTATASFSQDGFPAENLAKGNTRGWAIMPKMGQAQTLVLTLAEPFTVEPEGPPMTLRIEQQHGTNHTLGHFQIAATSQAASELPDSVLRPELAQIASLDETARSQTQKETLANAFYRQHASTRTLLAQIESIRAEQQRLESSIPTTLATTATEPRDIRVLPRGDWMDTSGPIVQPMFPEFLCDEMEASAEDSEQRLTRLDLADWLVSGDNPLVARTMVNRLWMLFFGNGICKTVDDLGSQGAWPTHPELLDWLAAEFAESGWDVKHLVRMIVLTDAYQRSSYPTAELRQKDPYNALLARQSRWRLEAEMVRDNALWASGLLVENVGGASVKPYQPAGYWGQLNFPKRTYQHDRGAAQYRRGLYTHWQRTFLHPSLMAFDAPAREECTARRPRSNTPLQSLVLLNDPTYVEAARSLAAQLVESTPGAKDQDRIDWLFQRVLQRLATEKEKEVLQSLVDQSRSRYTSNVDDAKALLNVGLAETPNSLDAVELASWLAAARAVFNLHETITRY